MWFKKDKEPEKPIEPETITLYAKDDLITRAENVVYLLGYRGAVGNYVIEIYRLLQKYEELDKKEAYRG